MSETKARPELRVEGNDDQWAVINLLILHGIDFGGQNKDPVLPWVPELKTMDGIEKLIKAIELAVRTGTGRTIGFLLDADAPLINRWHQVASRLAKAGVPDLPEAPPPGGFIGESTKYLTRVGVWLMPDNVQDGKLEDFLRTLVEEGNPLISHAELATDEASALGATFSTPDRIKAVLHAWLAWQDEPGKPYGLAIKARYFTHTSPTAALFVEWFRTLYQIA